MEIDPETYEEIARLIRSETSPVGIDAEKTHVYILHLLQQIDRRLSALEEQMAARAP